MKFSINKAKEFQPITIEITLETLPEVVELAKRLNICGQAVDDRNSSYYPEYQSPEYFNGLWAKLDVILNTLV
jgi:hypothetical protein